MSAEARFSQGQNLAVTVFYVPNLLENGMFSLRTRAKVG
jgi:hypothetical protein